MAKVLVIRKTDKTIHVVPLQNAATLKAYANKSKLGWTFEEMEENEAKELPFIDPNYVTAADATAKVADLSKDVEAKDAVIEALKAQLALLTAGPSAPEKAEDVIAKINAATTPEEVTTLLGTDERKTVQAAAGKRIEALKA